MVRSHRLRLAQRHGQFGIRALGRSHGRRERVGLARRLRLRRRNLEQAERPEQQRKNEEG